MSETGDAFRRLWQSVGFRLAFYYGLMVTVTMLATVSIIYAQTVGVLYQGISRHVQGTSQKLTALHTQGGPQAVVLEIRQALSDEVNTATELFLYLDPQGRKLVGNMETPPLQKDASMNGVRHPVVRGGVEVQAYLTVRVLADGSRLYVGSDLRDQQAIDSLVTHGITAACTVAVLILVGGLFLFRLELERGVETIRHTLSRVASGELKQRVGPLGQNDEFALLGNDINKMLDQVEILMNGVRHVSDTIAHNLRTPLTRIHLRLRNLADQPGTSAVQKDAIEATLRDIEELISVFEKLLQIAEAEAGTHRINFQTISLTSVVAEVLDFYATVAEATGATLVWECAGDDAIQCDPNLMAGAIANLVDNALKYGGLNVTVTVRCESESEPGCVLLTVQDNGPGVQAATLEQLGTRFFRLDRHIAGHGLGLSSVKAIVALHGGHLQFKNAQPGLAVAMVIPHRVD